MKLYMFRTVPLSIIRSFPLYTQQYIQIMLTAASSCQHNLYVLLCVQWNTPDDGQRNCPKHVEFHSKNKFEKSVHLVGFIIRNLSRCTVTWTSKTETKYNPKLATGCTVRGSNPGGGEIFRTRPDRLWGPPSSLYNRYLVFPGVKAAGTWR